MSGSLVTENWLQLAINACQFALTSHDSKYVLIGRRGFITQAVNLPRIEPHAAHFTIELPRRNGSSCLPPAQRAARAMRARTKRRRAAATSNVEAGAAH